MYIDVKITRRLENIYNVIVLTYALCFQPVLN